MAGAQALILSVLMLAAAALAIGAAALWRRGIRRKAGLMLVAALVMLGNVLILAT